MADDGGRSQRIRRAAAALSLTLGGVALLATGCGGSGSATDTSSTTAPVPEAAGGTAGPGTAAPHTASVAELDLCEAMGDGPAAAFLGAVGSGPVDQVQGRSTEEAAVCGWFVATVGDGQPEGVLVRAEPRVDDGNVVCTPPSAEVAEVAEVAELAELSVGGDGVPSATGWVTEADGRVQAAVLSDAWCAYLQGPAAAIPGLEAAAEASAALLGDALAVLQASE